MPDIVCDTSAIQYLFQLDLLQILPALADRVFVPPAVMDEFNAGRAAGVRLPDLSALDWLVVQRPISQRSFVGSASLTPFSAGA